MRKSDAKTDASLTAVLKGHGWAILTLGMAYGATITFTFFGPVMLKAAGSDAPALSLVAVAFHVLAFYLPDFGGRTGDGYLKGLCLALVPAAMAFGLLPVWGKTLVTVFFAWTIGRMGCFWTRHTARSIPEGIRGRVIAWSLSLSFIQLYLVNMTVGALSPIQALAIPALMVILTLFCYGKMRESLPRPTRSAPVLRGREPHYFSFLLLVYTAGGFTYAGIYPFFEPWAQVDRYVNVAALFIAAPLAGYLIDRRGVRTVFAWGVALLLISLMVFLTRSGLTGYLGTQCFLQAGWGFINVFGWFFSWSMAGRSGHPYHFPRGIAAMLLGAALGAFGAHLLQAWGLTGKTAYGLLSLVPLCLALVWLFFFPRSLAWQTVRK